uniref:Gamma-soluble NSF attachment protein n=1 Tax=Eptatretus burgeri TaxID=7764 RepID=A0A8C4QIQ9_EPTBU
MGFRSELIAGHFRTVQRFALNHSWVLFEACLGSWSCCKTHDLRWRPSFLTLGCQKWEMQRYPEAVGLIEKACIMYQENGTPDTAALALERAAKLVEGVNSDKAIELYSSAADVYETEERTRQAAELYGKVSRLLVRSRRLDEAAQSLEKEKILCCQTENYPLCFKKTIAQVLVHLHRNDYVAADKALRETYSIPGFSGSEDSGALGSLLEAYDQLDQDGVSRVCLSPLFKYMDNEYAKLAVSLTVPGGGVSKKVPEAGSTGMEQGSHGDVDDDEDEYSGGLC